jgi:hypothetical protein
LSWAIAEKSWVNEVALMSGMFVDDEPVDPDDPDESDPDELLPQAAATIPATISPAAKPRLLVIAKVCLQWPCCGAAIERSGGP